MVFHNIWKYFNSLVGENGSDRPNSIAEFSIQKYCTENNVETVAIRSFVKLRSVNMEADFSGYNYFGAFIKGPQKYPSKAIKHDLVAKAYFDRKLGQVRNFAYVGVRIN